MKLRLLFICGLLMIAAVVHAQQPTKPEHRFAIRLNALGLLSISEMLEFEYSITHRVAVFVGSGVGKEPVVNPFSFYVYRNYENMFCKETGWSAYTGVRIGVPVWRLVGLSLKGVVAVGHHKSVNLWPGSMGCTTAFDIPEFPDLYYYTYVAGYACVAYAQTFGKHFFLEPVLGCGPVWSTGLWTSKWQQLSFAPAMQLNLGVRF